MLLRRLKLPSVSVGRNQILKHTTGDKRVGSVFFYRLKFWIKLLLTQYAAISESPQDPKCGTRVGRGRQSDQVTADTHQQEPGAVPGDSAGQHGPAGGFDGRFGLGFDVIFVIRCLTSYSGTWCSN